MKFQCSHLTSKHSAVQGCSKLMGAGNMCMYPEAYTALEKRTSHCAEGFPDQPGRIAMDQFHHWFMTEALGLEELSRAFRANTT